MVVALTRRVLRAMARRVLVRLGVDVASIRRMMPAPIPPVHTYANGISTGFAPSVARDWQHSHSIPLLVVIYGPVTRRTAQWVVEVREHLPAHFFVPQGSDALHDVDRSLYTEHDFLHGDPETRLRPIMQQVQRFWRRCDVLLVDAEQGEPGWLDIVRLQHAARVYDVDGEIGIVAPAYKVHGATVCGYDYDRAAQRFVVNNDGGRRYGQTAIPRYSLTARAHGLLITRDVIDHVAMPDSDDSIAETIDEDVSLVVMRAWRQNVRTLVYAPVVLRHGTVGTPRFTEEHAQWLAQPRAVASSSGRRRIIFVLNATSISGGIRVVFEEAEGLAVRGFDVEIWSLQGQPDWTEIALPIVTFRSYFDMLFALRNIDAIKVATWWETQQVVWLASVNTGVPVSYVQEFETWFYPSQPYSRAAVASSARREFATIATASYQGGELREVGVEPTIIPVGYDHRLFYPIDSVSRKANTVLTLGRSFFQKNFAMTRDAWLSLGNDRPTLILYGYEPDILQDERVRYEMRPSNARVNELYNEATCFVATSLHEGFGLPIVEAMAAGCPVITTDTHGNRDFCTDGVNCLMVPQNDPEALAATIRRLLGDPVLQSQLSQAGLETARDYRWRRILDDLASYYSAVR